jgi:hypothetical protein
MTERHDPRLHPPETGWFEIRVTGHLDEHWKAWFDGMTVSHEPDGTTCITGEVTDQAALHGQLQRVRDLGMPLISVRRVDVDLPDTSTPSAR